MDGKKNALLTLIKGIDSLIIPVYQRNYDWTIEQCRQLLNDIKDIIGDKNEHFFGSIVSVEREQNTVRLIIDGQQRIVTVSLMLVALNNLIKQNKLRCSNPKTASKIFLYYLFNDDSSDGNNTKLQLVGNDQIAFNRLLKNDNRYIEESNLTRNYNFICDQIQRLDCSADDVLDALKCLSIIDITLDSSRDNAQKIFESLNSTGLELNEGDKIRNFALMNLTPEQQRDYYNNYWHKIETLTKSADNLSYDVSGFVRDYLTFKTNKVPKTNSVYFAFKAYASKNEDTVGDVLGDMLKHARYYNELGSARTSSERANKILRWFNELKVNVSMPYFLAVCDYYATQKISEDDFVEVFRIIEAYALRRLICKLPSNSYNKIFPTLHRDALKQNAKYIDALKYVLTLKTGAGRFPFDEEFLDCLSELNVMDLKLNNRCYLFARLEDGGNFSSNVLNKLFDKDCIIERVMPKTLSRNWIRELGSNADDIHETWCNKLSNFTIVDANFNFGTRSFNEQKSLKGGFKDSSFRLNKYLAQCSRWTEQELRQRNEMLKLSALKLWQYPKYSPSTLRPLVNEIETCTIDEDINLTGKKIVGYTLFSDRFIATTWTEMFSQVLRSIYKRDSSHLHQFANDNPEIFYKTSLQGGEQISANLYVKTVSSTNYKIKVLQRIFDVCGFDKDELELEFKSVAL